MKRKKILFSILVFLISLSTQARIWYVKVNGTGTNGTSWATAVSAQYAIINSTASDELWFHSGIYLPTADYLGNTSPTDNRTKCFYQKGNIAYYGGFNGSETQLSQRNWRTNITIFSGDLDQNNINDNANAYHVFYNHPSFAINNAAILDGFRIIMGRSTGTSSPHNNTSGAGMYNFLASPTIRNVIFTQNSTDLSGVGAIYNQGNGGETPTDPIIENCIFFNNEALNGEAIAGVSSNAIVRNSVFLDKADNPYSDWSDGRLFYIFESAPVFINCTFIKLSNNNRPLFANYGNSNTVITNCIIKGVAIVSPDVTPTITYTNIEGGYAGAGNINTDPLFTNIADPDGPDNIWGTTDDGLILKVQSACVNTGNNAVAQGFDLTQAPRIQNQTVDMGAYETSFIASIQSGNWENANTWDLNRQPLVGENVLINANHQVIITTANAKAKNVTYNNNASLQLGNNLAKLELK